MLEDKYISPADAATMVREQAPDHKMLGDVDCIDRVTDTYVQGVMTEQHVQLLPVVNRKISVRSRIVVTVSLDVRRAANLYTVFTKVDRDNGVLTMVPIEEFATIRLAAMAHLCIVLKGDAIEKMWASVIKGEEGDREIERIVTLINDKREDENDGHTEGDDGDGPRDVPSAVQDTTGSVGEPSGGSEGAHGDGPDAEDSGSDG